MTHYRAAAEVGPINVRAQGFTANGAPALPIDRDGQLLCARLLAVRHVADVEKRRSATPGELLAVFDRHRQPVRFEHHGRHDTPFSESKQHHTENSPNGTRLL